MNWLRSRLPQLFGIDLRTLALFRAAVGAVLLADLLCRVGDARSFYSDNGVMPRGWLAASAGAWRLSLHTANGQTWFEVALLLLAALAALALLLGWRARLAAALCFVLQASLLNRNPLVAGEGDVLLCCLLLWSAFLPLGARWSVDSALAREAPRDHAHLSWASAALLLQVLSAYFFTALRQSGAEWWPDGSALYYALQLDMLVKPAGMWLRQFPDALPWLSWGVWLLQLLGPLLALSPVFTRPLRLIILLLFALLQLALLLLFHLGLAPLVGLAAVTVLAGGWTWDALDRRIEAAGQRRGALELRLYYDRDCGFCLNSCLLLRAFLVLPHAQILPAQDYARARALLEANRSWVVIDRDDHAYLKWPALVLLLRRSPLFAWLGWLLSGGWAVTPGNAVYDFIGRHRAAIGKLGAVWPSRGEPRFESGRLAQRAAAVLLFAVLAWNLSGAGALPHAVHTLLTPPLRLLRLDQDWTRFAPAPPRDDGWFVFPGELADGTPVDVLRPGSGISYDKPRDIARTYPDLRWQQYLQNLWLPQFAGERPWYGAYLCREWNHAHPAAQALKGFKMIYMLEQTPPPGIAATVEQRVLWRQDCGAGAAAPPGTP